MSDKKLYGLRDWETVLDNIEEVIERHVEDSAEIAETWEETVRRLKWPLEVLVFRRMDPMTMVPGIAARCIESALEHLDEELGDPDGDYTEATSAMDEAAQEFARKVCAEYVPWNCERTDETVLVTQWAALKQGGGK